MAVAMSGVWFLMATAAGADEIRFGSSIGLLETWTNNVNLAPSGSEVSAFVTQVTPGFAITEKGPRTRLVGSVSLPVTFSSQAGGGNNLYVDAALTGTVEAVEKFFFIDGSVSVSQQYLSPFGAQPPGLTYATQNRYTSESYSVSPYVKGVLPSGVTYQVRDDNYWTVLSQTPVSLSNSYYNDLVATATRNPTPFGWTASYERTDVTFTNQPSLLTQLARFRAIHQPEPQVQFSADVGYENNDYTFTHYRGAIYGVGGIWHPTDRTNVEAWWEHRFFGGSYLFNFTHRTSLTVWNVYAARNITTYPQQIAALPAGANVQSFLNQLFLSSFPDPAQRQTYINQFINDRGLSATLSGPVPIYTNQIVLQEPVNISLGLIGARNTIFFTAAYLQQQPITAAGNPLPGLLGAANKTTQEGGSVIWTHVLAPDLIFALNGTAGRTKSNVSQTATAAPTTKQAYVTATLTSNLSRSTSLNGGVQYTVQRVEEGLPGYTAASVFVGLNHTFR